VSSKKEREKRATETLSTDRQRTQEVSRVELALGHAAGPCSLFLPFQQ